MIINATNAKTISRLAKSNFIEKWQGCAVIVYAAKVSAFGQEKILLRELSQALGTRDRDVLIAYIELAKQHQEYH